MRLGKSASYSSMSISLTTRRILSHDISFASGLTASNISIVSGCNELRWLGYISAEFSCRDTYLRFSALWEKFLLLSTSNTKKSNKWFELRRIRFSLFELAVGSHTGIESVIKRAYVGEPFSEKSLDNSPRSVIVAERVNKLIFEFGCALEELRPTDEHKELLSSLILGDDIRLDRKSLESYQCGIYRTIEVWGMIPLDKLCNGLSLTSAGRHQVVAYYDFIKDGGWDPPDGYRPLSEKAKACIKKRAKEYANNRQALKPQTV